MKEKVGIMVSSALAAIGIAAVLFCISGIVFDIIYKGNFHMENYSFTKMVIGVVAVGLGFGLPAVVYENDNMPVGAKVLIHMGIGCVVLTITGFVVGWIPTGQGVGVMIASIAGEIAVAFVIWLIFCIRQKKLANRMNERISGSDAVNVFA